METMFLDIFKLSPVVGIMVIMWYYQRKDYIKLVEDTRKDSQDRENKLQTTIEKNQDIISSLTDRFNVVDDVKKDVEEIKEYIFK